MAAGARQWMERVRSRLALLEDELLEFASRRFGAGWADETEREFSENYHRMRKDQELQRAWALFHRRRGGGTVLEEFVAASPKPLPEDLGPLIEAERAAWASYWKVTDTRSGESLQLQDLLTGEARTVVERKASRMLKPGHVICARVLQLPEGGLLRGTFPIALWGKEPMLEGLVEQACIHYAQDPHSKVHPACLRADGEPLAVINCWRMLSGLLRRPRFGIEPDRQLQGVRPPC